MKYIIFSKFNSHHYLFLSYFIISTTRAIINLKFVSTQDIISSFHSYYISSLSDFVSIIPILIIKKRSKSSKDNGDGGVGGLNPIELLYTDLYMENISLPIYILL